MCWCFSDMWFPLVCLAPPCFSIWPFSGTEVRQGYARAVDLHISVALHQRPKGKRCVCVCLGSAYSSTISSCCCHESGAKVSADHNDGVAPPPALGSFCWLTERLPVFLTFVILASVFLSPRCRYSTVSIQHGAAAGVASCLVWCLR